MNSASLILGPGYLTFNGGNFRFGEGGIKVKFVKNLREVTAEEFGRFDSAETGRMIELTGKLWSGYENLPLVLPSAAFTPVIGGKLFGTANLPAVVNGQDGSRLTIVNSQIVGIPNMMLSVSKELWSGDVKIVGLLKAGNTPDQAGSYYTYTTGNAYAAPAFVKTNFRAPIVSASWGGTLTNSGTSFAAFNWKNGLAVSWKWDVDLSTGDSNPCFVEGFGVVDAIINGFEGEFKGTPIGVLEADSAAALLPAQALGVLESVNGGDLTNTFGANSIVGKSCFVAANEGFAWSRKNNRIGDLTWRSTVPFVAGAPTARAVAA